MKQELKKIRFHWWLVLILSIISVNVFGQTVNAAYVNTLYKKYPIVKSNLCADCYLWVNPYYKSIADTKKNYPVIEHVIITVANVQAQQAANVPRKGVFAEWNVVTGQPKLDAVYTYANTTVKKPIEFAYGHCGLAWILAARDQNGAIFSDTECFGEFLEWQGQNVGTMIATEDTTRQILGATLNGKKYTAAIDHVDIWAGCVSNTDPKNPSKVFTKNGLSVTLPDAVWKIIKIGNQNVCYWMPNLNSEVKALLVKRHIAYADLVKRLGFDPQKVLN
jgi:hypothetical protein